jgi:hypothetical protein
VIVGTAAVRVEKQCRGLTVLVLTKYRADMLQEEEVHAGMERVGSGAFDVR